MGLLRVCVLAMAVKVVIINGTQFSWTSCAPEGSPVTVTSIQVEPDPLVFPGDMTVSVNATWGEQLGNTSLQLTIKRKTIFGDIAIPCPFCNVEDICHMLDVGFSTDLGAEIFSLLLSTGMDFSQCPPPVFQFLLDHETIPLPAMSEVMQLLIKGEYVIRASAVDLRSMLEIVCLDLNISVSG